MKNATFREQVGRLISGEIMRGTPATELMQTLLHHHVGYLLSIIAMASLQTDRDMERLRARLERLKPKKTRRVPR